MNCSTVVVQRVLGPLLIFYAGLISPSFGADASTEGYCDLAGYTPPQRQTLIVLDERLLASEPSGQPAAANAPVRKLLFSELLVSTNDYDTTLAREFEPRERLSVFIARKDGVGVREVFSGCLPFFSAAEKKQIASKAGYLSAFQGFIGSGPVSDAKKAFDIFRIRAGQGLSAALKPAALSPVGAGKQDAQLANSGMVTSMRQGGAFIDLAYGVPRVIIYSDMTRYFHDVPADVADARKLGKQAGEAAAVDLKGAEVYVVGMSGNPRSLDVLSMFFLASHGELVSAGSADAAPRFSTGPSSVLRFQGVVRYPDNQFPIRIRLAFDASGNLRSSWLSVQTSKEQFGPLHGVITCEADNSACTYSGDEVFAQLWNPERNPGKEPKLDPSLPFGGARVVNLQLHDSRLTGSISDPLIRFQGVESNKLQFTATRQTKALF